MCEHCARICVAFSTYLLAISVDASIYCRRRRRGIIILIVYLYRVVYGIYNNYYYCVPHDARRFADGRLLRVTGARGRT